MAELTGHETSFDGPYGRAEQVPLPDIAEAAETVCTWLLTAPHASPAWSQYMLGVVRLRDNIPGFPPPNLHFPGATHELDVVALDPRRGTQTAATMQGHQRDGTLPYLTPVNVIHQLEGSDSEALRLAAYAARAVVHGHLTPEPDGPSQWKASLVKTLAHIRGEVHAP